MTIKLRHVLPLLTAGAAAAVIAAVPSAAATNPNACINTGRSTVCETSGHAEISTPNPVGAPSSVKGPFIPPITRGGDFAFPSIPLMAVIGNTHGPSQLLPRARRFGQRLTEAHCPKGKRKESP